MSYLKSTSRHDRWLSVVAASEDLLATIPRGALVNEAAFRDYLTRGAHCGTVHRPTAFELDADALERLWLFIHDRAQFDMDATLFDHFNEALRARGRHS
jgi:hypothetical protein